jgi:hypothetical protein
MTPTTTAPLPVVAAWVWTDDDEQAFCRMQWSVAEKEADDLPAVAVPLALFEDEDFIVDVIERAWDAVPEAAAPCAEDYVRAIAAELRARVQP